MGNEETKKVEEKTNSEEEYIPYEEMDIAAILDTYAYLDANDSDYYNQKLSDILTDVAKKNPSIVENPSYQTLQNAIGANEDLGEIVLVSQSEEEFFDPTIVNAYTFRDGEDYYIVYRGTGDGKWVDDGDGMTHISTQMQREALYYYDHIIETQGLKGYTDGNIIVSGHSKGGNNSEFILMFSKYGKEIDYCISLDGQAISKVAYEYAVQKWGIGYVSHQEEKMYLVCGEDDYVHGLIISWDKKNVLFVQTPEAENLGGFHDVNEMIFGGGLYWQYDSEGNIISTEQGTVGKFADALAEELNKLDEEDLDDCAITIMSLFELLKPYDEQIGGRYKWGTGDRKFATVEEFMGFISYGIPTILYTLIMTEEGRTLLGEYILSGLDLVYTKYGVLGVVAAVCLIEIATVSVPVVLPDITTFTISYVLFTLTTILYDKVADFIVKYGELLWDKRIDILKSIIALLTSEDILQRLGISFRNDEIGYLETASILVVDTGRLRDYAARLEVVVHRIRQLDQKISNLYRQSKLSDLSGMMKEDVLQDGIRVLQQCINYLDVTADEFEEAENKILSY